MHDHALALIWKSKDSDSDKGENYDIVTSKDGSLVVNTHHSKDSIVGDGVR